MLVAAILSALTLTTLAGLAAHARRRVEVAALARSIEALAARLERLERLEIAADAPQTDKGPAAPSEPIVVSVPTRRRDRGEHPAFSGPTLISVPDLSHAHREATAGVPEAELSERYRAVWELSEAGATTDAIARATGHPVGQVELILGLRRRLPTAPRGAPRSR